MDPVALVPGVGAQPGLQEALEEGRALEDSGDVERALNVYRALCRRYPDRSDLLYRLQGALVRLARYEEAIGLLKERLRRFPSDGRAQLALGDAYFAQDRVDEAVVAWEGLIAGEKPAGNYELVASRYRMRGMPQEAVSVYLKGRQALREEAAFAFELAGLYEEGSQYPQAVAEYLRALVQDGGNYLKVQPRILELGKDERATEVVLNALAEGVGDRPEDNLRVRLLTSYCLSVERPEAALSAFVKMGRHDPAAESILLQIALECAEAGAYSTAEAAFHEFVGRFPSSPFMPRARLGLARAVEGVGKIDSALAAYEEVQTCYPQTEEAQQALFRIAEVRRLGKEDLKGALAAYRQLLGIRMGGPWQRQATLGVGSCLLGLGDINGARLSYDLVPRLGPGSREAEEAAFRLAELEYLTGQMEKAQMLIEGLIAGPVTRDVVNNALELSELIQKGKEVSGSYLEEYAAADLLQRQGEREVSIRAFLAFVDRAPMGPLADRALMVVVRLQADLGRYGEAAETCRRISRNYAKGFLAPEARLLAAALFSERLGRFQDAISEYEAIISDYPDSPRYEEARLGLRKLQERIRG